MPSARDLCDASTEELCPLPLTPNFSASFWSLRAQWPCKLPASRLCPRSACPLWKLCSLPKPSSPSADHSSSRIPSYLFLAMSHAFSSPWSVKQQQSLVLDLQSYLDLSPRPPLATRRPLWIDPSVLPGNERASFRMLFETGLWQLRNSLAARCSGWYPWPDIN